MMYEWSEKICGSSRGYAKEPNRRNLKFVWNHRGHREHRENRLMTGSPLCSLCPLWFKTIVTIQHASVSEFGDALTPDPSPAYGRGERWKVTNDFQFVLFDIQETRIKCLQEL